MLKTEELGEILREEVEGEDVGEEDVLGNSKLLLEETRIRAIVRAPRRISTSILLN